VKCAASKEGLIKQHRDPISVLEEGELREREEKLQGNLKAIFNSLYALLTMKIWKVFIVNSEEAIESDIINLN
jgi:hypothetical protein